MRVIVIGLLVVATGAAQAQPPRSAAVSTVRAPVEEEPELLRMRGNSRITAGLILTAMGVLMSGVWLSSFLTLQEINAKADEVANGMCPAGGCDSYQLLLVSPLVSGDDVCDADLNLVAGSTPGFDPEEAARECERGDRASNLTLGTGLSALALYAIGALLLARGMRMKRNASRLRAQLGVDRTQASVSLQLSF